MKPRIGAHYQQEERRSGLRITKHLVRIFVVLIVTVFTASGSNSEIIGEIKTRDGREVSSASDSRGVKKNDGIHIEGRVGGGIGSEEGSDRIIAAGPSEEEAKQWNRKKVRRRERVGKGKKVRVTYRGDGFGTDVKKIHVTINGVRAPGIVLHNRSTISFEIPQSIWKDESVLKQSILKVSVGNKEKLGFLPLVALIGEEDWGEGSREVENGDNVDDGRNLEESGNERAAVREVREGEVVSELFWNDGDEGIEKANTNREEKEVIEGDLEEASNLEEKDIKDDTGAEMERTTGSLTGEDGAPSDKNGVRPVDLEKTDERDFRNAKKRTEDDPQIVSNVKDNLPPIINAEELSADNSEKSVSSGGILSEPGRQVSGDIQTTSESDSSTFDEHAHAREILEPSKTRTQDDGPDGSEGSSGDKSHTSAKGKGEMEPSKSVNEENPQREDSESASQPEPVLTAEQIAIRNMTMQVENLLVPNGVKGNQAAARLLEEAAELGDDSAMASLGSMYLAGDIAGIRRDVPKAVKYLQLACDRGNADGQALMGLLYATGLASHHGISQSMSKAILYWRFAAGSGSEFAQMALAYRHLNGLDTVESCTAASMLYEKISLKVAENFDQQLLRPTGLDDQKIPPQIVPPVAKKFDFSDQRRLSPEYKAVERGESNEMLQMYRYTSEKDDPHVQVMLGLLHYHGTHGMARDHEKARAFFEHAAERGNLEAHANLGLMDLQDGDNVSAYFHFKLAQDGKDLLGMHGAAYCLLHGLGTKQDVRSAALLYLTCTRASSADAAFNLGILRQLGLGIKHSAEEAFNLFKAAAHSGHILSSYFVGSIYLHGSERVNKNCGAAAQFLKLVAEEGVWPGIISKALRAYEQQDYSTSLYRYLQAAHAGIELGQYNAAFLYEKGLVGDAWSPPSETENTRRKQVENAMHLYEMSALQGNTNSMVRIGDLAYTELEDYSSAAEAYMRGSKAKNAEATFNMGWMHWRGLGVKQDVFMAKRYFDSATEIKAHAMLPAYIATRALFLYNMYNDHSDDIKHVWGKIREMWLMVYAMEMGIVTALLILLGLIYYIRERRLLRADELEDLSDTDERQPLANDGDNAGEEIQ